ncbi:hypothetical protein Cgig2_012190 [Carnegiea gigantea]|uniref:Bifunctional inhibitor/plant lipid transfer protein/seed storage helical domain-containing protein n=1 Tax=Carnegiea gigantea TaxID=171969 RepID=A0A9Q1QP25_9CARY|nr:hypothetical protein Cgig2_012190 [Carnegiea gigantea]
MQMFKLKATLMFITVASMVAFVSSNFTKDKQECQDQLITLSSCLNYVAGSAIRPSPQCCAILDEKINKTKRCLCLLVRDRNEPSLGLKLNATRAVRLPTICHATSNPLECLGFLNLTPSSPDAQIFIDAANDTQAEPPAKPRSSGGWRRWAKMGMLQVALLTGLVSLILVNL